MRTVEAEARRAISSRPSLIRNEPLRNLRPFGARALRVIKLLGAGWSRLEAARKVGLDKANVRVIELRARRRGMLAGVETRVVAPGGEPAHAALIRLALAANAKDTDGQIAARVGVQRNTVALYRDRLGLPRSKRGPRGAFGPRKVRP